MKDFSIERTGEVYSASSSEFRVTYPDGHVGTIWSPVWNQYGTDAEEIHAGLEYAKKLFAEGRHKEEQPKPE